MDRVIKFRFWRDNSMQLAHRLNAYDNYNFAGDGEILMQFTGLYDCEGKEIYEGDIVKGSWGYSGVVNLSDILYAEKECTIPEDLKVLGNIYEHPNLLNNESNT